MKRRDFLKFSTSPILAAIPESFLDQDLEEPFTMIFWARNEASGKAPQMFVIEGHGQPIWQSFAENILNVPNIAIAELAAFDRYLDNDEKLTLHHAGRELMGKAKDDGRGMTQWITISNRPGRKIDLDEGLEDVDHALDEVRRLGKISREVSVAESGESSRQPSWIQPRSKL